MAISEGSFISTGGGIRIISTWHHRHQRLCRQFSWCYAAQERCKEGSTTSPVVCSDRSNGGYGEVDAKVFRDSRMPHAWEVEPARPREVLTIEAEHGGIIGQGRLKAMSKFADP